LNALLPFSASNANPVTLTGHFLFDHFRIMSRGAVIASPGTSQ
jgi:hypothetical protein